MARKPLASACLLSLAVLLVAQLLSPPGFAQPPAPAPKVDPDVHPFERKFPMGEFPAGTQWMNTRPLKMKRLKGKFVLLDFWTYCCINCIHVLPELKKLEEQYADQLVVIGVHSAKFETEKDTKNISEAILRYEIKHPVINDGNHQIWNSLGIRSWPTVVLIDPEGNAVWGRPGEIKAEDVASVLDRALPYYRKKKLLDETPVRFELLANDQPETSIRFPGKVLADEAGGRLFITDSNHNRIVVTDLSGKQQAVIGAGPVGAQDGAYDKATFHHPQGLALHKGTLYVSDTENHLLRKVNLKTKQVTTIAGLGKQARFAWPGLDKLTNGNELPKKWVGPPKETALNSPWALWVHGKSLYIAMAGPHQIWHMPLDESSIGPFAGSSREDIIDGKLLPDLPPQLGQFFAGDTDGSAFAQPSGLTSDGTWLYVADSEGSSIRAVPFDKGKQVRTVVGTADLPRGRLFAFGDVDGKKDQVRLQHALGVAYHDGRIYVADTYNNKIKIVDAKTGDTRTLAGTGKPGVVNGKGSVASFDEPAGIAYANGKVYVADTNNHAIRVVDASTGDVSTLTLSGVSPPAKPKPAKPSFAGADKVAVPPQSVAALDGKLRITLDLILPDGWKLNPAAPWECWVESARDGGAVAKNALGKKSFEVKDGKVKLELLLPAEPKGEETLIVSLPYFYCSDGGLCKFGSVVWTAPLTITPDAKAKEVVLTQTVAEFRFGQ